LVLKFILDLNGKDDRRFQSGAKAINLAKLIGDGFPVPRGFALTYDALSFFISVNALQEPLDALLAEIDNTEPGALEDRPSRIRQLIEGVEIPGELKSEIEQVSEQLSTGVSVRSSSNLEDRANFSFAGQHDSFLNISGTGSIEASIKKVWASGFSDRAMAYLRTLNMPVAQVQMGVIIQEMVQADSAGVSFSIHPVTGDKEQIYINAALGLGENTVSGQVTPDEIVVLRESKDIEYKIGINPDAVNSGADVEAQDPGSAKVLTDEQISELTDSLRAIEVTMGGDPQDVEWAFAAGQLSILQARPMVTRDASTGVEWKSPIPGANWRRNWRLGEWIPEAVTPLFSTWILPKLVASREQFGTHTLGWEDMTSFSMPQPWFCLLNGYFFTRTDFPPFMMDLSPAERMKRMMKTGERVKRWHTEFLPTYVKGFEQGHRQLDIPGLGSAALVEFIEQMVNEAGEFWSFIAPIGYGFEEMVFKPYYDQTLPDEDKPHHSILFSGFTSRMHDAQVALYQLAEKIRVEGVVELVVKTSADDVGFNNLPAWLQSDISEYDREFGHQVVSLDVYFSTLGETPEYTITALQGLLGAEVFDPAARLVEVQNRRHNAVEDVLNRLEGKKRKVMKDMIEYYQGNASVREDANFYLQIGWPLVRKALQVLGVRLVEAGVLADPEEVFFLEQEELLGTVHLIENDDPAPDLARHAHRRQDLWAEQRLLKPPMLLSDGTTPGKTPGTTTAEDEKEQWDPEQGCLSAIGTSPGIGVGQVRVVISSEDAKAFQKGEVLVIKAASPLFTPMMLTAAALVVEVGGGASHSSLVARELGLPAVVNATDATRIFNNGEQVQVDGTQGEVRRLD
jgi:phosphohistidine swiveling domain-containing protein